MKTPEQMAEEWVKYQWPEGCQASFLAGYKAAKLDSMRPTTDVVGDALSAEAIQCAQRLLGPKPSHYAIFTPPEDSDTPDLQEQIEALQEYMTVAQRKIMALEEQVESLRCDLLVAVVELRKIAKETE